MEIETLISNLSQEYEINPLSRESFWELNLNLNIGGKNYKVRPIQNAYEVLTFGIGLSNLSKDMFCPYAWDEPDKAIPALQELIEHHQGQRDLAYLIFDKGVPVGFFFLWNIEGNITELGEGIIDTYHNKGLGGFALDMLTTIADILEKDAVELTTDLRNAAAKHLYESRRYERLGIIKNPLEIDQTKSFEELKEAGKVREEYQMAKIFRNREKVLEELKQKREKQSKL